MNKDFSFYSIGFFGCPNFGDELLCSAVANRIKKLYPASRLSITTLNRKVSAFYTGLEANFVEGFWPDPKYFRNFLQHLRTVKNSDLIVIGGGGLISDKYSRHALVRYCIDPLLGILLNKQYVFVGIGVLELNSWIRRSFAGFLADCSAEIYCRDTASAHRLEKICHKEDILVGPDLAFLTSHFPRSSLKPKDYAIINIRENPSIGYKRLIGICSEMLKYVSRIVFLAAESADTTYFRRLLDSFEEKMQSRCEIAEPSNVSEAMDIIAKAEFVVAARFHVNIAAVMYNKPLVSICYEEKVSQFISQLDNGIIACRTEEIDTHHISDLMGSSIETTDYAIEKLSEESRICFDNTIKSGLTSEAHSLSKKIKALIWLTCFIGYGVFYALLVSVKRFIFGRGPIHLKGLTGK